MRWHGIGATGKAIGPRQQSRTPATHADRRLPKAAAAGAPGVPRRRRGRPRGAPARAQFAPMPILPLCAMLLALPWLWPFTAGPMSITLPYLVAV